ncbi:unnamed protein product [Meganyctiphanes norvegica]|uniref:Uncharacterized protein n=1 Tax=Meganyctiphanes norvegica TaxID=48144 RepID=A0AAV2Q1F1_MEGNR
MRSGSGDRGHGGGGGPGGGGGQAADGAGSAKMCVRKASYYVWFLGAEECRGLRGGEYVRPVVHYLIAREQTTEPDKVTLQVSSRGIKLLQVVGGGVPHGGGPRGSSNTGVGLTGAATKHFIPAGAVTYVQQEQRPNDDIVSAILLIYNPITRCPVHVHTYRCDSVETATLLRENLSQLVHLPEQQVKLQALEARLSARGILPPSSAASRGSCDGSSTGGSSASSSGSNSAGGGHGGPHGRHRNGGDDTNYKSVAVASAGGGGGGGGAVPGGNTSPGMATLYDSLAAELREKLGSRGGPLLLPPRDYDQTLRGGGGGATSHWGPGSGNQDPGRGGGGRHLAAAAAAGTRKNNNENDSARSSGIGSDDAPSPTQDHRQLEPLDNQSSSDEEWEAHGCGEVRGQEGMILVQSPWKKQHKSQYLRHSQYLQRSSSPTRGRSRHTHASPVRGQRHGSPTRVPREQGTREPPLHMSREMSKDLSREITRELNRDPTRDKPRDKFRQKPRDRDVSPIRPVHQKVTPPRRHHYPRDRSESPVSPRDRFQDARDKFRSLEREIPWLDCNSPGQQNGLSRAPSWDPSPKHKDSRGLADHLQGSREALWPKSDRDTGYGSRDGLLRERRPRDHDRGYGTCDTRDSDPWRTKEMGQQTPELWQMNASPGKNGYRGRSPTRDYKNQRPRTPDKQDYHRAKSMHDLSQRKGTSDDEPRNDPRRRSMYDTAEDQWPLKESRSGRQYLSQASLRRHNSCSSESCASDSSFRELPETQRYPGLDRSSARPNPLDHEKIQSPGHISNRRTFDYPLNGGAPAVQINRTYQDDYRRSRYEPTPQFIRSTPVPTTNY